MYINICDEDIYLIFMITVKIYTFLCEKLHLIKINEGVSFWLQKKSHLRHPEKRRIVC